MTSGERVQYVTRIFREYGPAIRALIDRYIREPHDVDDAYQNIFVSMARHPPSHETSLPAYLNAVVKNYVRDAVRRSRSRRQFTKEYVELQHADARSRSPEADIDAIDCENLAQGLVTMIESSLPHCMAQAIVERYVHGRSLDEIASLLNVQTKTISRYCCTGLKHVRQLIIISDSHVTGDRDTDANKERKPRTPTSAESACVTA